jgi:hypothetical protein
MGMRVLERPFTLSNEIPYNPLDKQNLQETVARALTSRPPVPLAQVPNIDGSGVYALYYSGVFRLYEKLVAKNKAISGAPFPIYVGKAEPSGRRIGSGSKSKKNRLQDRLNMHANSIRSVRNLEIADFTVRYLAIEEAWVHFCEIALIEEFQPIWNSVLHGFGNNPQGKGREGSTRSLWDSVHPGRPSAESLKDNPSVEKAREEVSKKLELLGEQ